MSAPHAYHTRDFVALLHGSPRNGRMRRTLMRILGGLDGMVRTAEGANLLIICSRTSESRLRGAWSGAVEWNVGGKPILVIWPDGQHSFIPGAAHSWSKPHAIPA